MSVAGLTANATCEVSSVVVWLLGDGAGYVNGQAINVCGGLEMD